MGLFALPDSLGNR